MNWRYEQAQRVTISSMMRTTAIILVAVLAACNDMPPTGPEMKAVSQSANFWEFGYWACTSAEWHDGSSQRWCTFHENSNYEGGLPPTFPFDPNEPITGSPTCETYGACGGLSGPSAGVTPPDQAPEGVSQEDWTTMNDSEKKLCYQNVAICAISAGKAATASLTVKNLAKQECNCETPDISNNRWDAIRHAYWQALLRRDTGVLNAIAWATAHEDRPNNPRDQVCMDEWNNYVGRVIAAHNPGANDHQLLSLVMSANLKEAPYSC